MTGWLWGGGERTLKRRGLSLADENHWIRRMYVVEPPKITGKASFTLRSWPTIASLTNETWSHALMIGHPTSDACHRSILFVSVFLFFVSKAGDVDVVASSRKPRRNHRNSMHVRANRITHLEQHDRCR